MLLAYQQDLNPLGNAFLSTFLAALPVLVLFWLLVPARWLAPKAALGGTVAAVLVAIFVYGMPAPMAGMAFVNGVLFGLLPVGWNIFNAMLLYNITVETGQFNIIRRSVAGISGDARVQAILIGFAFNAFLEGAAGGGTPVAICGAIMVGLGFNPFLAAALCLIGNTTAVVFGGLATPLLVLNGVTGLPTPTLSVMAGHQLAFFSLLIPIWMVKTMCTWKQTWEVWPALLVLGGSFAFFQYAFSTSHTWVAGAELFPMTAIGASILSLVITAVFMRFWRPRQEWHFTPSETHAADPTVRSTHPTDDQSRLTAWKIAVAWAPFALMSIFLLLSGFVRQQERQGPIRLGPIQTSYAFPLPGLHNEVYRDSRLQTVVKPERAEFDFNWLTASGTSVFLAVLLAIGLFRMSARQVWRVLHRTCVQMKIPIPTIALMLGLSYVTRFAGMDATLGVAFAATGLLYPFFAPILGWLGVFLTGTDAGSNALFGSLQKITATEIYKTGAFTHLGLEQSQVLISTANASGGVMGKMINAQSICVATAATYQIGKEADLFKAVIWHSLILAGLVGLLVLLQAYVWPFTLLVPG
jgi:lactate permease